jgi:hypothetical protein
MGKFVPEDAWIETNETEKLLREALREYNVNVNKFENTKFRAAGVRARNNIQTIIPLLKQRRKEILAGYKDRKLQEHPSWEGVDDGEASSER